MGKKIITELKKLPPSESLAGLVDNLSYRNIDIGLLPIEIREYKDLCKKFNSVLAVASGSAEGMSYVLIGNRADKQNTVIDEHPFFLYYDKNDPSKDFGFLRHHGDWKGRTSFLSQEQIDALNNCGLTTEINFKNIPQNSSGSFSELVDSKSMVIIKEVYEPLDQKKNKKYGI